MSLYRQPELKIEVKQPFMPLFFMQFTTNRLEGTVPIAHQHSANYDNQSLSLE